MKSLLLPSATLIWREVVGFYRQRSRLMSALVSPLVLWLVIGSGLSRMVQSPQASGGQGYLEFFFPGTIMMVILFTAIFSTISIIEDRKEGFLQSVLVAPVSRSSIVLGRIGGAAVLSLLQAVLFLFLAPFVGIHIGPIEVILSVLVMFWVGFGLAGMGFLLAWRMESVQGFHAIMMLLLMPMWVLCGAVFPSGGGSTWVSWVMMFNPLTYGMALLRRALYFGQPFDDSQLPGTALSIAVAGLFGLVLFVWGLWEVRRRKHPV